MKLEKLLIDKITEKFLLEGHNNTGEFLHSLEVRFFEDKIEVWGLPYGIIISEGIEPQNIPFSGRSGRGGQSKYLTGLKNWVQTKLSIPDEREALNVAFAIAHSHKERGMVGSKFLDNVMAEFDEEVDKEIEKYITEKLWQ